MVFKHVELSLIEDSELSIDGETKPAGNIEIREFEDGEWIGGSYVTYENLVAKVKEALDERQFVPSNKRPIGKYEWPGWNDYGGEG